MTARQRLVYRCTTAQQRFWVLDEREPGAPAQNVAVRWELAGAIDPAAIEQAWRVIVDRHETLRSFITPVDGELCQVVEPELAFAVRTVDLTGEDAAAAEAQADALACVEARAPFRLSVAPLLRVTQIRLPAARTLILVTAHHIICDGWSVGVLAADMGRLLAQARHGRAPSLPPLPLQYGEFAEWQRDTADPEQDAASLGYWREQLRDLRQFELPTDHARPRQYSAQGDIVSVLLTRAQTDLLGAMAMQHGCSLFTAALAGLLTLLHRCSGEIDIAVGTQLAGRDDVALEGLVGVFINTVVLRTDLSGTPSFAALMARVRETVTGAMAHGAVPFEAVVAAMKTARDLSRNPLFSINFIFQRSFVSNAQYGEVTLTDRSSVSAGALYDLNFFMVERPEGWRLSCEYSTAMYDAPTVAAMVRGMAHLLEQAANAPEQPIGAFDMVGPADRRFLLETCNRTAAAAPPCATILAAFAQQVRLRAHAPAVTCGGRTLDYAALDGAVWRLAQTLRAAGVAPGDRVGVLVDRSVDLVVALLGVMACGAAYVPLDPAYPKARLEQIVADAQPAALVSHGAAAGRLDLAVRTHIVLDTLEPAAPCATSFAMPDLTADQTAYVIYTSGSTGVPKGVEIGHHALMNLLWAMRDRPGLEADDVWLGVTTVSFDIAALEIFLPLIMGAQLVLADDAEKADGAALLRLLRRHRVTVMQATPVTWRMLLDAGWQGTPRLRMLCGGEVLPRPLADALLACGGPLWNMYGPTETTIWSAALQVEAGTSGLPIGGPIANTQLHVLDAERRLVLQGAVGELHIGGAGLARGYWGKPALTAERFVADPFCAGQRLYRTGDLVRRRADGTLDFFGRTDHQVKLRGLRIELGAVEATLLGHAYVRDAVVVVGQADSGEAELWGYVASPRSAAAEEAGRAVRVWLTDLLPAYMVPARLMVLDALPRTPNGKVDRAALPRPPGPASLPGSAIRPTGKSAAAKSARGMATKALRRDDVQARVGVLWGRVLGLADVQEDADFFELGGNSLTAARLIGLVNAEFERTLRPAVMFKHPTLGLFVDMLQRPSGWDFDFSTVLQLQPEGTRPTLFALNNTGVFYRLSRRLGRDQPFVALQLFDPAGRRQHEAEDFRAIAADYVALIEQAQPRGPCALIGWCIAGSLALEVAEQLKQRGRVVCLVVIIDAWAPGHTRRQRKLQARLTDLSLRVQTVGRDASRVVRGRMKLAEFVQRRRLLRRLVFGAQGVVDTRSEDERYHQTILNQLLDAAKRYDPPEYAGQVLLLRARDEPAGLFIDPALGWGRHVHGRLHTVRLSGDHSSIFAEPGLQQMADSIAKAMDESAPAAALA